MTRTHKVRSAGFSPSGRNRHLKRGEGTAGLGRRGGFVTGCLIALLALGWSEVQAAGMKVTLKDGKEIIAARAEFDGRDFRIVMSSGVEIKKGGAEVLSIETESAVSGARSPEENAQMRDENARLEAQNKSLRERLLLHEDALKRTDTTEKTFETELQKLRDDIKELYGERAQLEKDKQDLGMKIIEKDNLIEDLKKGLEAKPTPEIPKPHFEIRNPIASESPLAGATRITGLIANQDSASYRTVVLEISVLGSDDKVLGIAHTFLTNLEPGDSRPFSADIETAFDASLKIKVVPALVF